MKISERFAIMLLGLLSMLLGRPCLASVRVPLDVRPGNGMLMVSGAVDGVPCRMLFDTGATHTTFDLAFVTNKLPRAELRVVEVLGRTNVGTVPRCFPVGGMQVGEHMFPASMAMAIPLDGMSAAVGERVDGILGMSDLSTTDFVLQEKEVVFAPDAAESAGFGPDVRKSGDALRPCVSVRHDGREMTLLVDSGSTFTFLREGLWKASENDLPLMATEISGQQTVRPRIGEPGVLDMGVDVTLRPMIVSVDHCCLGSDALKACDILFGASGSRISFRPRVPDRPYASEADSFLAKRDGSVQPRQIAAILEATAGRTNDLAEVRQARNAMAPLPDGVEAEMVSPKMRLYRPKGGRDLPLLVYLHGGGWVIGSIASCSAFCGELAAKGCAVLALDYPLAPERPYPASLDFTCAAYRDIVAHRDRFGCDPRRVALGGDSSGGNLALAAALRLQADGLKPAALVLYYPVTEARADGTASWRDFATGCGMDAAFMDACNAAYLQGRSWEDPLISPMCAGDDALRKLPPVNLLGADRDVLRDQGKAFADRLRALGAGVRYELPVGSTHLFVTVPGQPTAFRRAVDFAYEAVGGLVPNCK